MSIHYGKNIKTRYFKYTYENWEQPVLTSNGTIDGNSFACSATNIFEGACYYLFDNNGSSYLQCRAASGEIILYNPTPICITKINIVGLTADGNWWTQNVTLYGSNDNSTWTSITTRAERFQSLDWVIPNTNYYKYYKIYWERYGSFGLLWHNLNITAEKIVGSIETDETDYDYTIFEDGKIAHFHRGDLYRIDYFKGFINNFITVGTPTINKSLASGFTTVNNYLLIPAIPTNTAKFETILKVKFSNNTTNQHFFNTSHTYGFLLSLSNVGKLFVHISGNGTSWNIASNIHGTTVLAKDTWYYVRCSFDGTQYKIQLSTDCETWTDEITIQSTLTLGSTGGGRIGSGWQQDTPGSYITVDLKDCYIKIDDEYFWQYIKHCKYDYNFTTVGMPNISNAPNCKVSGFSTSNYISLPENFNPQSNAWEEQVCFTTGDNITTEQQVICNDVPYWGYGVEVRGGKLRVCLSNGTGSFTIYDSWTLAVSANTKYYVKTIFNGSNYTCQYSLDGDIWVELFSVDSTTPINGAVRLIGVNDDIQIPFLGSIDLTQSYIKINNELWWSCFKTSTDYVVSEKSTVDDYDYSKPYKGEIILAYKGKDLVHSIYPNGVVFEENTAGTYTISPAISGPYEISLVGPGSGGTAAGDQPSYASKSRGAGGGSGAYVKGIWNLTRGVDV